MAGGESSWWRDDRKPIYNIFGYPTRWPTIELELKQSTHTVFLTVVLLENPVS